MTHRSDQASVRGWAHAVTSVTGRAWVGYAAALWALLFAGFHAVWATGWYVGLAETPAATAFAKRWFLIYDLVVAGLMAVGVPVALALFQPWGDRVPRRPLGFLAWTGTGLLALRGGGGVVQSLYFLATGRPVHFGYYRWDLWFCLGAVLFAYSTGAWWRAARRSV